MCVILGEKKHISVETNEARVTKAQSLPVFVWISKFTCCLCQHCGLRSGFTDVCLYHMRSYSYLSLRVLAVLQKCVGVVLWGWRGYALLVCVTLAMGCCRRGPAAARWGLWSVTQSPQPWIKLMLQIPSLQLSCAPGGRTTFEQRDLAPARGWCLFNMCFECSDWLTPLTGRRREDERKRERCRLLYWLWSETRWRLPEKNKRTGGGKGCTDRWWCHSHFQNERNKKTLRYAFNADNEFVQGI